MECVAQGLNYFDKNAGEWQLSKNVIELTPDGGAAAIHGPHKAYFKAKLSSGITLVTKKDREFVTRPLGIYYFDPETEQSIELAGTPYQAQGFVVDYITVSGSGSFTFSAGGTYYISGWSSFNGTVTFNALSVIKYANNAYLLLSGTIVCNGTTDFPTIMTSANEDIYGARIDGSTGTPTYAASYALWPYFMNGTRSLTGFKIRWARTAIYISAYQNIYLNDSSIEWSSNGALLDYGASLSIFTSSKCTLGNDYSGGSVWGSFTDNGVGDSDSDGLPDSWEYKHFGTIDYSGTVSLRGRFGKRTRLPGTFGTDV